MKKILLILFIFTLTGCYDYKEINDISFVSGIALKYDDKYTLSMEILDNNEDNESFILTAEGDTITNVFDNITLKSHKDLNYSHLKVLIIDNNVSLKDLSDYIVRNPSIRNEFYLCTSLDPIKLFNTKLENLTISESINKLIYTNEKYIISYNKPFEDILEKLLNDEDIVITNILLENDILSLNGLDVYQNYKYILSLDKDESSLLNILINNDIAYPVNIKIDNENINIKLYDSINNTSLNNNELNISLFIEGKIEENNSSLDLKKDSSYKLLNKKVQEKINNDLLNLLKKLQNNKLDLLDINNKYYIQNKEKINVFPYLNINLDIDIQINKKGLIFNE